ncbi:putative periplasmic protein [Nautilia profundicola AmH]|uniref:Periplasmic protein n=1 Tax=Nautilia profundicola (strain ATCC BAA-1463 / DSM 18972 / AmH) TaxID=598659 RepID=B9L9E9_NAUPA|nr:putative periplasmic protein [Nautilia profundicola AmH]
MLRISLVIVFFASFLFAEVKIFATKAVDSNGTITLQNPIIIYNNSIIQAKHGLITKKRKIILNDKVFVTYQNKSVISANSLIAYSSRNIEMNDIFFYDKTMEGWILAKSSLSKNKNIYFKKLYFSTCCIKDPDWFMKARSATYNREKKSLKLYNLTLVINKIPVFYLPYFYVNFDKTRRSGLLRPYVGFSQTEGLLYSQPIYFVTSINTDLEITPTFRSMRGKGVYTTFRFVDSPTSKGMIKAGYFKDDKDYYIRYNLAHQKHYGYNIKYERNGLFTAHDALYMNLKYANDVDYFYLDAYNYRFNDAYLSDKLITSELNYINVTDFSLYGSYFKYFIDTTKLSNDTTWQILPQLNYHHFLSKKYGLMNLLDINIYNYYRKVGSNFVLADLLLPVSVNFSLFNDYLKFKITELLSSGYGFYYQTASKKSKYTNLSTQIKLYTSLTKAGSFIHIISPSLILNLKNYSNSSIYTDLMNVPEIQNYLTFNLFQIFEKDSFKLTHTLNDTYYLTLKKYSDLENIFNININNITIEENNRYSIEKKQISYNNIKISYNNELFYSFISHVYQKNISEAVTVGITYNINTYKKVYTEYSYDLNNRYRKYWLLGMKLNKKCWRYDLSFKQSRIPILEEDGISYRKDNIVTINVELKPIGGLNQTFVFKGNK